MAHTCLTAHKSTGRQPTGQLAPQNVPPPQESHHDSPPRASPEEEPFEIELVVLGSQQLKAHLPRSSSSRRTMMLTMKVKTMKSTLP
jgi:hypothetical protein